MDNCVVRGKIFISFIINSWYEINYNDIKRSNSYLIQTSIATVTISWTVFFLVSLVMCFLSVLTVKKLNKYFWSGSLLTKPMWRIFFSKIGVVYITKCIAFITAKQYKRWLCWLMTHHWLGQITLQQKSTCFQ